MNPSGHEHEKDPSEFSQTEADEQKPAAHSSTSTQALFSQAKPFEQNLILIILHGKEFEIKKPTTYGWAITGEGTR